MNRGEEIIKQKYEELGWTLVHGGAPDFLAFKRKGKEIRVLFIEVKGRGGTLSKNQSIWKEILERCGLEFKLEPVGKTRLAEIKNKEKVILKNVGGICKHLNLSKQCTEKVKETALIILKRIPKLRIKISASVALMSLLYNDVDVKIWNIHQASNVGLTTISVNVRRICSYLGISFPKTNRQVIYYPQLKNALKNNLFNINVENRNSDVLPLPVAPNAINSKN